MAESNIPLIQVLQLPAELQTEIAEYLPWTLQRLIATSPLKASGSFGTICKTLVESNQCSRLFY
jgi:hypothetical protein